MDDSKPGFMYLWLDATLIWRLLSKFVVTCPYHVLYIRQFQQMLFNYVNFRFSTMKKLSDLVHEKLVSMISGHGILD